MILVDRSVEPPGTNPTMISIALVGYFSCAWADTTTPMVISMKILMNRPCKMILLHRMFISPFNKQIPCSIYVGSRRYGRAPASQTICELSVRDALKDHVTFFPPDQISLFPPLVLAPIGYSIFTLSPGLFWVDRSSQPLIPFHFSALEDGSGHHSRRWLSSLCGELPGGDAPQWLSGLRPDHPPR